MIELCSPHVAFVGYQLSTHLGAFLGCFMETFGERGVLLQSAGTGAKAFNPLEKDAECTDVEECVLQPLRSFLISWVRSLFEFQTDLRAGKASGSATSTTREQTEITGANSTSSTAPESLNMPQTSVLSICLPGQEMCSFLILWQSNTPHRASMVSMSKSKIEETINRLEVTVGAATALPMSNPIMAIHSMARDVFWKASEHSQEHIQSKIKSEDTLIPRGALNRIHELLIPL